MVPKFFDYEKPTRWFDYHDGEADLPVLTLHFSFGPALSIAVDYVPEDRRQWFAETLHRQIASIIYAAEYRGESGVVHGLHKLMRLE